MCIRTLQSYFTKRERHLQILYINISPNHNVLVVTGGKGNEIYSNKKIVTVYINIANNHFTHMKTNGNIALLCCVSLGYNSCCWRCPSYACIWLIFVSFSMPLSPYYPNNVCVTNNNICMSYYFEDIVVNRRVSSLFWATLYRLLKTGPPQTVMNIYIVQYLLIRIIRYL